MREGTASKSAAVVYDIAQLGRQARWAQALHVASRVPLAFDVCSALVTACGRGGQWQRAVHLWADHLHRNVVIYTATITACTRSNAWAAACQVLSDMEQRRVAGNEFTCSAAISAFQASSKWQEAVHLLEPTSGIFHHLRPNVVIYNGVLSACDVAGQWQRVLGMLGKMCEKALQPDLFSYVTAMTAINRAEGDRWEIALQLLHCMKKDQIEATVALHNAALGACATGSQWRLVFHSLDRLSTTVQIDEVTYGTALNAAVRGSAWQRTVALFGEMCRSKVPINTIILNTVLSACERGSQWSTALHLLGSHLADATSISLAVAACCAAGHWRRALALNVAAPEVHVAAMKACARGEQWMEMLMWLEALKGSGSAHIAASDTTLEPLPWTHALQRLRGVGQLQVQKDLVLRSSTMASAKRAGSWQHCGALLEGAREDRLEPDLIVFNTYLSALEASRRWQQVLLLLGQMGSVADVRSLGAGIVGSISADQWPLALELWKSRTTGGLPLDLTGFDAAITACVATEHLALGHFFLWRSEALRSATSLLWALAELRVEDPEVIQAACAGAAKEILRDAEPTKLAQFLWCLSMLGASNAAVQQSVARTLQPHLPQLPLRYLSEAAASAVPELLLAIQAALVPRLPSERLALAEDGRYVLGILHSASLADLLLAPLQRACAMALRRVGRALDAQRGAGDVAAARVLSGELLEGKSPQLLRGLIDRAVLYKPEGWEVYDNHSEQQLADFAVEVLGQRPIFSDREHNCGFLHRLDVPSSGLILVASTFEAFYDLQLQLVSGLVHRQYLALLHGTWRQRPPLETRQVPGVERPTRSGGRGKLSRTTVTLLEHLMHGNNALSRVSLQIGTGRKHQIRSQLAHLGHPVLRDGLYSSTETFEADAELCPRNWLHRQRLVFRDLAGESYEVFCPLPWDLENSTAGCGWRKKSTGCILQCQV